MSHLQNCCEFLPTVLSHMFEVLTSQYAVSSEATFSRPVEQHLNDIFLGDL